MSVDLTVPLIWEISTIHNTLLIFRDCSESRMLSQADPGLNSALGTYKLSNLSRCLNLSELLGFHLQNGYGNINLEGLWEDQTCKVLHVAPGIQ